MYRFFICPRFVKAGCLCCAVAAPFLAAPFSMAQAPTSTAEEKTLQELKKLPYEELIKQPVTTASRKEVELGQVPAAVYVLTGDEVRQTGALSIPEALRYVPGVDVAQVDSHRYAISVRGFNWEFANKLLVLMDGRSIYNPVFSGVLWDDRDVMLEDLDRIEVVRGPGGTLWGANAVNGVINIISKSAKDTQGLLISSGYGNEEKGFGSIRYGGKMSEDAYYRVYVKGFSRDNLAGGDDGSDFERGQTGFRIDWQMAPNDTLTLEGDYFTGRAENTYMTPAPTPPFTITRNDDEEMSGADFLGRWTHRFEDDSETKLQFYYDRTDENRFLLLRDVVDTLDVDFQHQFHVGDRNEIIYGAGYRYQRDSTEPTFVARADPKTRNFNLFSVFAQDEFQIVPKTLSFTVGTKVEHNDYTGIEFQPNARLAWTINEENFIWASVSRAVRTPSRVERDLFVRTSTVNVPGPLILSTMGDDQYVSEKLIAYELGYRVQPDKHLSFDLAAFYNTYSDLASVEVAGFTPSTPPEFARQFENKLYGETYGVELAIRWQITDWWSISPSYTLLKMAMHRDNDSTDPASETQELQSPQQQFSIRSTVQLPAHWEFDAAVRYVDQITVLDGTQIPNYAVMDMQLAWRPSTHWELAFVGRSLFNDHEEFRANFSPPKTAIVERSLYAKVTWRF